MPEKKVQKLTREGYKNLEKKLKHLKGKVRLEIAERIRQAKEFGEISENTEYENAKSEQARVEQEIMKLEMLLRNAQIIEKKAITIDEIQVGVQAKVKYLEENKEMIFELVSSTESDPTRTPPRISDESPIGSALMGKKRLDVVEVEIPLGKVSYEVLDIMVVE